MTSREHSWEPSRTELATLRALSTRSRRVFAVFPHPDDESYGCAGTLFRLAQDPQTAVVLLILTSGEAASIGRERGIAPMDLAKLRENRLKRVTEWLQLDQLLLARLPDGEIANLSLDVVSASMRSVLQEYQPQVVLGHDARGVNAHPDHIATHWGLRRALQDSLVLSFAQVVHGEAQASRAAPRLLFSTPSERIHCQIRLSAAEIAVKERCLLQHEAIVTTDRMRAERENLLWREPVEQWQFFGERFRAFASLLEDLPADARQY